MFFFFHCVVIKSSLSFPLLALLGSLRGLGTPPEAVILHSYEEWRQIPRNRRGEIKMAKIKCYYHNLNFAWSLAMLSTVHSGCLI